MTCRPPGSSRSSATRSARRTPSPDAAVRWLEAAREPFFLFAHYYDPHAPYAPPEEFRRIFADQPYDGEIDYTDQQVGRLLRFLGKRKALDRTLVIIVSDHGEGLEDHGEPTHGLLLYDTTVKVVLIVKPPKDSPATGRDAAGKRCGQTVMLTDVFPTVLEMLGFKQAGEVDGRSLVPALRGGALPPRVSYIEALCAYFAYRWSPLEGRPIQPVEVHLRPRRGALQPRGRPRGTDQPGGGRAGAGRGFEGRTCRGGP